MSEVEHTERAEPYAEDAPRQIEIAAALRLRDCLHSVTQTIVGHGGHSQATTMLAVLSAAGLMVLDNCRAEDRHAGLMHASEYFAAMAAQYPAKTEVERDAA